MTTERLRVVVGVLMVVTSALYTVPQLLRSRRGYVAGVSLPAVTNVLASYTAWVVFAVYLRDPWVFLTNVVGLPALVATTVVLLRRGADRSGMGSTYLWAGLLVVAFAAYPWRPEPATFLAGIAIVWYVGPAVLKAWSSPDVSGVSAGAWLVVLADAAIWAVYAVLASNPAFLAYAVLAAVGSALVLLRVVWPSRPCGRCRPLSRCRCGAPAG